MKRRKLFEFMATLCVNFWYAPIILLLLAIKLCLISVLISSVQNCNNFHKFSPTTRSFSNRKYESLKLNRNGRQNSPEHPQERQRELMTIQPSAKNRTHNASIWMIYNRVPRSGGSTLVNLINKLSLENGFTHHQHQHMTPWPRFLTKDEQSNLVMWFEYQHLPMSYDRHFYFVDFKKYEKYVKETPIYINMIRHPVRLVYSFFYARRLNPEVSQLEVDRQNKLSEGAGEKWLNLKFDDCVLNNEPECRFEAGKEDYTLSIPFFCGQKPFCVKLGSSKSLQEAKLNIEKHYSVVGILEEFNISLKVLDKYIPKYFHGAYDSFFDQDESDRLLERNFDGANISEAARLIVEKKLEHEMDLYRFAYQRLNLQYEKLHRKSNAT